MFPSLHAKQGGSFKASGSQQGEIPPATGGADTRHAAQHPATNRTALRESDPVPNVTGAQVCNHGGGSGAGFEAIPAGGGGSSERCVSVSARRCKPPPFGVDRDAGGGVPSRPLVDPYTRITKWTFVSLAPKKADREARKDPWARKTVSFSRPRPLSPPSVRERFFSPEEVSTALGSRTPRTARVSVRNLRLRHGRGRGLQAAAVAPPNRLSTAPQVGGWGGAGLR